MFEYWKDRLTLNQGGKRLPLADLAQKEGRPFYLYDADAVRERHQFFRQNIPSVSQVFYAVKANNNKHILKALLDEGAGADIVSAGEMRRVLKTGFPPQKIVFSGAGKTKEELTAALKAGLFQINAENLGEIEVLARLAERFRKKPVIALRINPDMNFRSHPYIKTGLADCKFGFSESHLPEALRLIRLHGKFLKFQGLSMHIGSQIFDSAPFLQAIRFLKDLFENLQKEGFSSLKTLDIGGGWGVNYNRKSLPPDKKSLPAFGKNLQKLMKGFEGEILAEPGRFLTAPFGLLCSRVEYVKKTRKKSFVILNTGMNHLLRPALYGAFHAVLPFDRQPGAVRRRIYEIAGPVCETADVLNRKVLLPEVRPGDWLAIRDAGAYGFVMANNYNLREPAREVVFAAGKRL